ncbi:hypothetical protein D3C75_1262460 [compost metagenome]
MIQRVADLGSNPDRFIHLERRPFFDNFVQILAFHILHNNIMDIVFLAYIINADHIRVRQRGCRLCFTAEAADKLLIMHKLVT